MSEFFSSIANYILTGLTALMVYFFKQLHDKQTVADAKEVERQLREEINELKSTLTKQQEFIYRNVATKSDLENLKEYFKEYLDMFRKEIERHDK